MTELGMENRVFDIILNEDDITWKDIIFDLIKAERLNPWDLDVSLLANKFIQMLNKLREMDFRVSGKVVLAAALLLKYKSDKLLGEDIEAFDDLLTSTSEEELEILEMAEQLPGLWNEDNLVEQEKPQIVPKTPQPRQRKVSVYDLVKALEKALETKNNRKPKLPEERMTIPKKTKDISLVIGEVYNQIVDIYNPKEDLTFETLLPSEDKEDKVLTFIPLLHLDSLRKIDLLQEEHFGQINIDLLDDSGLDDVAISK